MINRELEKIYNKIVDVYPFLSEKERIDFEKKAKNLIKKTLFSKKGVGFLLNLLKNPHAYLWVWKKPSLAKIRKKRKVLSKIENRTLSLTIPSWSGELGVLDKKLIDICVKNIERYDGILIDVRNNQGGNSRIAHSFASIFFKTPCVYGKFIKRKEGGKLFSVTAVLQPNSEIYLDKSIVILTSNKCFSSNELFLAPFKVSGRAILIGEKTRGGSGNPMQEEVSIGHKKIIVLIPTWRFFLARSNDPIEKTKINPDIIYKKKNILNFAVKYLQEKSSHSKSS